MVDTIPLRQLVLYKHGVGYFTREGIVNGRELLLPFRANEVDDALKSLTVFTLDGGQVAGVHYRTPEDQGERLAEIPLSLGDEHSLFDLLRDLRGTDVSLELRGGEQVQGRMLGVEEHVQGREHGATLVLLTGASSIEQFPTEEIARIELGDERMARDLNTFLDLSRSDEARREVIVALSEPGRQVQVSYTIPSPVWRVSYRLVDASETQNDRGEQRPCLLQGWGIFDNRLDEDLEEVEVRLVAGQPVSFRYDLTSSVIPERRFVRDEARIAAGPVEFDAAVEVPAPPPAVPAPMPAAEYGPAETPAFMRRAPAALGMKARSMDAASLEGSTLAAAEGRALDELFEYRLGEVSVKRGESAMVPVVQQRGRYRRERLYNGSKQRVHPVVSLRLRNETGLTLERGPVTVVEEGQYRGEAMLPFTKAGAEIVLAFAVELGISVQEEVDYSTTMAGLTLEDSFVHVQEHQNQTVRYRLINRTSEEQTVTVEQARWAGAELTDTPKPDEETGGHRRWRVTCPAGRETSFKVTQRRLVERREEVRDQTLETLSMYLETRFLDRAARKKLEAILRLRQRLYDIDRQVEALHAERQELGTRQDRLRQNLGITTTSEQEDEIRRRSAEQFHRTQDREEEIDREVDRLKNVREQAESQLQTELSRL